MGNYMISKKLIFTDSMYEIIKEAIYKPNREKVRNKIETLLANGSTMYLYSKNNKEVGLIIVNNTNGTTIELLGVLQPFRRIGIGKELVQYVINHEKKPIKLTTDDTAIGFYSRFGFSISETMVNFPDGIVKRYECIIK